MKNLLVVASMGTLVTTALVGACSDSFTGCMETRTCPRKSDAGAASSIGGAQDTGGSNGDALGGSEATSGGAATGAGRENSGGDENSGATIGGAGGAAEEECSAAETRCAGNFVQTCGDDQRFGEPEPCPADVPICHLGACAAAPSCNGLADSCGTSSSESCCTSPLVPGGTFDRNNDLNYVATVADFRLDKYEVTVGRFRQFVNATLGGWTPPDAAGKHVHLNGGKGLANGEGTAFEAGWQSAWTAMLPATKADWSTALHCSASYQTWSLIPGANEELPINCVDWIAAYAFCAWDGGFLPSATELNYAKAAGDEQRLYPWGDAAPGKDAELAAYGCYFGGAGTCAETSSIPAVGSIPEGAGKWGQLDLGGSVFEWSVDWTGAKSTTCDNCAVLAESTGHVRVGGSFSNSANWMLTSGPSGFVESPKSYEIGVRCARMP